MAANQGAVAAKCLARMMPSSTRGKDLARSVRHTEATWDSGGFGAGGTSSQG